MCCCRAAVMLIRTGHFRLGGNLPSYQTAGCGNKVDCGCARKCQPVGMFTHVYPRRHVALRPKRHRLSVLTFRLVFYIQDQTLAASSSAPPRADKERDGKGSVERSARAWPLVSNQTPSAGPSSITGFRLHLPTRQRLVQTPAPGDKASLNPGPAHIAEHAQPC